MNSSLEYVFYMFGNQIFQALLALVGACVGILARRYLSGLDKERLTRVAALFVEQCYKGSHGEEKMLKALDKAKQLFAKAHIKFDHDEVRTLIEAFLAEWNSDKLYVQPGVGEWPDAEECGLLSE